MKTSRYAVARFLVFLMWSGLLVGQRPATAPPAGIVPQLVNFSGKATDGQGNPISGVAGVTFAIYKEQAGGAPLWMETQNVTADAHGNYTAQLGAATSAGLPLGLFNTGEARWLGVRINGGEEQARGLLLSVPYAMKAQDAETVGGLPASAFLLAGASNVAAAQSNASVPASAQSSTPPPSSSDVTTTGGAVNAVPLFTTATNIQKSILTQAGTTAITVGGELNLPATGAATASKGFPSRPLDFVASSFSSGTAAPVAQTFQWQAVQANNNTANPSATLSLLYGSGTTAPAETGLRIGPKGIIGFAPGQTFPGTGSGTITGVTAGADMTGGGTSGSVTLNLDTTKVPLLAAVQNSFTGLQYITGTGEGAVIANESASGETALTAAEFATSGGSYGIQAVTFDGSGAGVQGISSATSGGYGVYGLGTAGQGGTYGVYGVTQDPTGAGVFGLNEGGSRNYAVGVFGQSDGGEFGAGVYGRLTTSSGVAGYHGAVGVWGDGGTSGDAVGVQGTNDDASAGFFANNSPSGIPTVQMYSNEEASMPLLASAAFSADNAGYCDIDWHGNLNCTGSKNAVVAVDGGTRTVALSAIESPVNWFEDAGSAKLIHGVAVVELDPTFIQTVNTTMDYKVFPVPNGDCKGLYVTNKTATSFEVRELGGGTSSVDFDYRIMAVRKNYEKVRFADHTHDLDGVKRMQERVKLRSARPIPPTPHGPKTRLIALRPKPTGRTPLEIAPAAVLSNSKK